MFATRSRRRDSDARIPQAEVSRASSTTSGVALFEHQSVVQHVGADRQRWMRTFSFLLNEDHHPTADYVRELRKEFAAR